MHLSFCTLNKCNSSFFRVCSNSNKCLFRNWNMLLQYDTLEYHVKNQLSCCIPFSISFCPPFSTMIRLSIFSIFSVQQSAIITFELGDRKLHRMKIEKKREEFEHNKCVRRKSIAFRQKHVYVLSVECKGRTVITITPNACDEQLSRLEDQSMCAIEQKSTWVCTFCKIFSNRNLLHTMFFFFAFFFFSFSRSSTAFFLPVSAMHSDFNSNDIERSKRHFRFSLIYFLRCVLKCSRFELWQKNINKSSFQCKHMLTSHKIQTIDHDI